MTKIKIPAEYIKQAKKESKELGILKNSFTKGAGNVVGILGEKIVKDYFNLDNEHDFDHDLTGNGKKIEVKTKKCTSKPKNHYRCSVSKWSKHQICDYYIFVRVLEDYSKGWILGYISQKEFYKQATFYRKGEGDKTSPFGWTFKEDCYNLPISKLNL